MIVKINRAGGGQPSFFLEAQGEHEEAAISEMAKLFEQERHPTIMTFRPDNGTSAGPYVLAIDFDTTPQPRS